MRTLLSELERGQELYYALHEELVFKTIAKRNRLFAEWAALRLGKKGNAKKWYIRKLLDHVFGDKDSVRLIGKVYDDLKDSGHFVPVAELRTQLYEIEGQACREVMEAIEAIPAAPVAAAHPKTRNDFVASAKNRAAESLHAIEDALKRAKSELRARKPLVLGDILMSYILR